MNPNIHTCPRCNNNGNIIAHKKKVVKLKCPECEKLWFADSKICPQCKQPNGFAVDGMCSSCYSNNLRDR